MADFENCKHERRSCFGPLETLIDICLDCGATREMPDGWVNFPRMVTANLVAGNTEAAFHGLRFMESFRQESGPHPTIVRQTGTPYPTIEEFKEKYITIVP